MSDLPDNYQPATIPNGWMKLFTPRGVHVTLPVIFDGDYKNALASVNAALGAGWLVECPGLEAGEEKDQVGWVVRGSFEGDRGTTPFLLLYSINEAMTYSFLKVYLNDDAHIRAFEFASKMNFETMPEYDGNDKPERGASEKLDRYFAKPKKPFTVVFKANPKYDSSAKAAAAAKGDVYKVPRRVFVRWANAKPPDEETQPNKQADAKPAFSSIIVAEWTAWLDSDPSLEALNDRLTQLSALDKETKSVVWNLIKGRADAAGLVFSKVDRKFSQPNNSTFSEF